MRPASLRCWWPQWLWRRPDGARHGLRGAWAPLRRGLGSTPLLCPWLLAGAAASAHPSTGRGAWADGLALLLNDPRDPLALLALQLLAAQMGALLARRAASLLPLVWLGAAVLGCQLPGPLPADSVGSAMLVLLGLMVALATPLPAGWPLLWLALPAGWFGLVSGARLSDHAEAILLLPPAALALFLLVALAALALRWLPGPWRTLAPRALGSWIAAAALLMLGWQLRQHG